MERLAESVGLSALKLDAILAKGSPGNVNKMRPTSSRSSRKATGISRSGKPSVLRRAITLLLHYPQAAKDLDIEAIADLQRPGADLLRDLIENVQAEPNITTAGILERWRHDEKGQHLGKLAAIEVPQDDEFDAAAEMADCLVQLAIAASRDRIDTLIEKERLDSLNEAEKTELRELGRRPGRAQNIVD
jgi:DNA primase